MIKFVDNGNPSVIGSFGEREILYALHDIDGTHSLIRDWPPVMSIVLLDGVECTGIAWENVAWYPDAMILHGVREDAVQALPCYEQGGIYLQNLSASNHRISCLYSPIQKIL